MIKHNYFIIHQSKLDC